MGIFLMVRVKWCAIHVVQGMIKTKQTKKTNGCNNTMRVSVANKW